MQLSNTHILITGGSSGIGLSLAQQLIEAGAFVTICGRNQNSLEKAAAKINSEKLRTLQCDVADYGQVERMVAELDQIDILINNAGIWLQGELESNSPHEIYTTIQVNLTGLIYLTQAVLPKMKSQNSGTIINVSSSVGLEGRANITVYAATKFGVRGFTDSLRKELADTPIKVIGFYPCGTKTELYNSAQTPKSDDVFNSYITPEEMAQVVVSALEQQGSLILDTIIVNRTQKI